MDIIRIFYLLLSGTGIVRGGIELGFSTVRQNTIAGQTVLEEGEVPRWLHGSFIRQACGSFGETGSNLSIINRVDHLFECVQMAQSYRFENGKVTFYNRYYDTAVNDLWKAYNMNMNDSRVYWRTVYSRFDYDRVEALEPIIKNSHKVDQFPFVTFWQLEDKVFGHSEYPGLVQIDPHDLRNKHEFHKFDDNNFGYTDEIIIGEDAHGVQEADGTLYGSHMVFKFNPSTFQIHQWKSIFKIKHNMRSTLAKVQYPDMDLSLCYSSQRFPILDYRQGYMHSIAMTENYIVLPESAYLVDPCSIIVNYDPAVPYYTQMFSWEEEAGSRLWVIRKSDGVIMANITTSAFFNTHQINAYEDNDFIHIDMFIQYDTDSYTKYVLVEQYVQSTEEVLVTDIHRFTISTGDWILASRSNLLAGPTSGDFATINPDYNGMQYTYTWLLLGLLSNVNKTLIKLNVKTHTIEREYPFDDTMPVMEPIFHKTPDSEAEDDGIILIQGLDLTKEKGFLMIFDARDLRMICHVTGTDLVLFGIHSKFYPSHIGRMSDLDNGTDNGMNRDTGDELCPSGAELKIPCGLLIIISLLCMQ